MNESLLKWRIIPFISSQKLLRYLRFCLVFFGYVGKQLDKKAKVNFKVYGVTNWNKNYYNNHIVRYLKKKRQLDNDVGQLIEHNVFCCKNLQEK